MSPDIGYLLKTEIKDIEARMSELQDRVRRNPGDEELIESANIELRTLHVRLDELYDREQKYLPASESGSG